MSLFLHYIFLTYLLLYCIQMSALIICNSIFDSTVNRYVCVTAVLCDLCLQRKLTSEVSVNGLAEADRLTLGVVRVWGVTTKPTKVTMKVNGKPDTDLGFVYNSEVRCFIQTHTLSIHTVRTTNTNMRNGTFYVDKRCCLKIKINLFYII